MSHPDDRPHDAPFHDDSPAEVPEPTPLADPSIADAFDRCVARGATQVLICPYFLLPGKHWSQDIPALAREAAERHPGVAFVVTAPIGLHPMMQDVITSRIDHCLAHIAGQAPECESCAGTGRCALQTSEAQAQAQAHPSSRPEATAN
jgi:sirohydrochlorin ferrochelatase